MVAVSDLPVLLHPIDVTATRLNVSRDTVRQMIAAGELPHVRVRRRVMVSERAIQAWLEAAESTEYTPR